jgi:hypothetical protein
VARREVNANQVFHWPKLYREGRLGKSTTTKLLPVKVLIVCVSYAHIACSIHKTNSVKGPPLNFGFVKWTPADGEVREEPDGKFNPLLPLVKRYIQHAPRVLSTHSNYADLGQRALRG